MQWSLLHQCCTWLSSTQVWVIFAYRLCYSRNQLPFLTCAYHVLHLSTSVPNFEIKERSNGQCKEVIVFGILWIKMSRRSYYLQSKYLSRTSRNTSHNIRKISSKKLIDSTCNHSIPCDHVMIIHESLLIWSHINSQRQTMITTKGSIKTTVYSPWSLLRMGTISRAWLLESPHIQ